MTDPIRFSLEPDEIHITPVACAADLAAEKKESGHINDLLDTLRVKHTRRPYDRQSTTWVLGGPILELYNELPQHDQMAVKDILTCAPGLNSLCTIASPESVETEGHIVVCAQIIHEIFVDPLVLLHALQHSSPSDLQPLFVGSRLLTVLAARRQMKVDTFVELLFDSIARVPGQLPSIFIYRALKLGSPIPAIRALSRYSLSTMKSLFQGLRATESRHLILSALLPYLQEEIQNMAYPGEAAALIKSIASPDLHLLQSLISFAWKTSSLLIHRVVVLLCLPHLSDLFDWTLRIWGDPLSVSHTPLALHVNQTRLVLLMASHFPAPLLQKATSSAHYLSAISLHLSSNSNQIRTLGVGLAECLSRKVDKKPLSFGIEIDRSDFDDWCTIKDELKEPTWPLSTVHCLLPPTNREESPSAQEHSNQAEPRKVIPKGRFTPMTLPDEEDSDDDPTLSANKEKFESPVYLKTLVEYLASDSYQKQRLALENAATLIRRKAKFGSEVNEFAIPLATELIGLKDNFNMDHFHNLRLAALSCLVSVCPDKVPGHLSSILSNGDYSLQQRMVILSAIALGAREMYQSSLFPSELLPSSVESFFDLKSATLPLVSQKRSDLQIEQAEVAKHDSMKPGKELRVSRKLQRQRDKGSSENPRNEYPFLAAKYFFFPLTALWTTSPLISRLTTFTYGQTFVAQYLRTLAILLSNAFPTSPELRDMTSEALQILLSLRSADPSALEAAFTLINVILLCFDADALVATWPQSIIDLQNWIESLWSDIPDPDVQALGARVLLTLHEITRKNQRQLIDRLTSLEAFELTIPAKSIRLPTL